MNTYHTHYLPLHSFSNDAHTNTFDYCMPILIVLHVLLRMTVRCAVVLVQSRECQSYTGIRGYSDTGVYLAVCGYPSTVQGMSELHQHLGIL